MEDIIEFGTDISNNFLFADGDLVIVEGKDNLQQSIQNRINTQFDFYSLFYNVYGGNLHRFFGWKKNNDTLDFIEIELKTILDQDPRLNDNYDLNIFYDDEGALVVVLNIHITEDSDLSLNYVLNENMVMESV